MPEKIDDEVVDFSNFANPQGSQSEPQEPQAPISAIQPLPYRKPILTTRLIVLIGCLIALVVAQFIVIYLNQPRKLEAPEGYRLVKPVDGPIRLEKLK